MNRMALCMALVMSLVLAAPAAFAAERTAKLVGFERTATVTGQVTLLEDGSLVISGFGSVYDQPLEVYVSRGYDYLNASFAGVLSPGFAGGTTLKVDVMNVVDVDMVLISMPGWSSPVGLGLLRGSEEETPPPPELTVPGPEPTVPATAPMGEEGIFEVVPAEESPEN